jgi:tetratricopeptide (TPR) repeat protein
MAIRSEETFSNFIAWSVRAVEHARTGHVEDALNNMRKAGEAAAKTIIAYRWAGRRAEQAIAGARFVDLIQTISRAELAPEGTTLLLRTLRVEGNAGAHDERVRQGRVKLGLAALEELAKWLCADLFGRAMPAELHTAFSEERVRPAPVPTSQRDPAQEERMAGIEAALVQLAQRTEQGANGPDRSVIDAINALHARLDALDGQAPTVAVPELVARQGSMPPTKPRSLKFLVLAASLLVVGAAAWWAMRHGNEADTEGTAPAVAVEGHLLKVLLLPLTVLQDDPNLRMDLPAAIANRLQERIAEYPWKAHVIMDTVQRGVMPTPQEAWEIGTGHGAALVIFGELLEPTASDSGRVTMGRVMRRANDTHGEVFRSTGFRTMADPAVQQVLDACVWWYDQALAERLMAQGAYSQALTVLQHARPSRPDHETTRRMFLAQCFAATGNQQAAVREAMWCREQGVSGPGLHAFLAELFLTMGDRGSALLEAEQAVRSDPENTSYMMLLAELLVDPQDATSANTARSERLVERVLERDGNNAKAWFAMAVIHTRRKEWDAAERCYERSLELDPANADAKVQLAHLLLARKNDAQQALRLANEVIARTDSMHVPALELAGAILTNTTLADPRAAMQVLRRAERSQEGDRLALLLAQGRAALLAGDLHRANDVLERCWKMDSANVSVAEAYSLGLMMKGHFERGIQVALSGLAIDSLDSRINAHLGEAYFFGPAQLRNPRKAEHYLSRSLLTDAGDTYVLNITGEVRLALGNINGAASVILAAYRLAPNDWRTNRNMGNLEQAQDRHHVSIPYYKRALALSPEDNETASNLAYSLLLGGPSKAEEGLYWSKRSVELKRSPENLLVHARLLLANKRGMEAEQAYREAIAQRPELRQQDLERVFDMK